MAEYVKRWDVSNACYDIFEEVVREGKAMTAEEVRQTMLRFEKAIRQTATADVVEVVRCGECKKCDCSYPVKAKGEEALECLYCNTFRQWRSFDDFCSYGERREI